jgi:hypothetical protein
MQKAAMIATAFSPRINVPSPEPFRQLGVEGDSDQLPSIEVIRSTCLRRAQRRRANQALR